MMPTPLPQTQATTDQPTAVLQILRDQEVAYTVQLSAAQRQRGEAAKRYERAGGAQKEAAGTQLTEFESRVAITQQRLNTVRERIGQVQHEIAVSTMGNYAPGATIAQDQERIFNLKPSEFTGALTVLFVFPIVLALSRWIWRRSPVGKHDNTLEANPQITRLEQAVESIAIEVERIGEAQRFSAKLLAERPVESMSERVAGPRRAMRPVITPVP